MRTIKVLPVVMMLSFVSQTGFSAGGYGSLPSGIRMQDVDYNGDGIITTDDVYALFDVVLGSSTCPTGKKCDLNGDGNVNVSDAMLLNLFVQNGAVAVPTGGLQYDYDNDGVVNINDYNILLNVASGSASCPTGKTCDLNGDGVVNVSDVQLLVNKILSGNFGAATTVTGCQSITSPGTYLLGSNLSSSSGTACIDIHDTSNVTLDCQGNQIAAYSALSLTNLQDFTLMNCKFVTYATDQNFILVINATNVSYGLYANNTIGETTSNIKYYLTTQNANHMRVTNNTIYAEYDQYSTNNSLISSNVLASPLTGASHIISAPIDSSGGSSNVISFNSIDGRSQNIYNSGADDGVSVFNESYLTVSNNSIKNIWDGGIEWGGLLDHATITGNQITNSLYMGIGGWYAMSLTNSTIANNTINQALMPFEIWYSPVYSDPISTLYFTNNTFTSNTVTNTRSGGYTDIPIFGGFVFSGPQVLTNNVFTNNNLGPVYFGPGALVSGEIVEGGGTPGNQCSYHVPGSPQPLVCH